MPDEPVVLNGVLWRPGRDPWLPNTGAHRFLPDDVDFARGETIHIRGRDTAVVEHAPDGITIHLADTPNGSDIYEIEVIFSPPRPRVSLRIAALIDGSDDLWLSRSGAMWHHRSWQWPASVTLNDLAWNVRAQPELANEARTRFMPDGVDFRSARVESRTGRDSIIVEPTVDYLCVRFRDRPDGDDRYELVLSFAVDGQRHTAGTPRGAVHAR